MKDIIRMAREAGGGLESDYINISALERFAELVRADEREACIVDIQMHIPRSGRHTPEYQMAIRMIERIRARSNK